MKINTNHFKATPEWYKEELKSFLNANESPEPLTENILSYVRDTVSRYKDRVVGYKMFNEPLHGEEYRGRYDDIWNRVFNEFKSADPNVQLMVNDYNIAKADCGQCIVDLVKGWYALMAYLNPDLIYLLK